MYFIQRNCQLLHRRSHKAPKRSENPPAVPAARSSTSTPASLLSYMQLERMNPLLAAESERVADKIRAVEKECTHAFVGGRNHIILGLQARAWARRPYRMQPSPMKPPPKAPPLSHPLLAFLHIARTPCVGRDPYSVLCFDTMHARC